MSQTFSYKDKYGGYKLSLGQGIIHAEMIGALGDSLSKRFYSDLQTIIQQHSATGWGYFSDLTQCEGMTKTAEQGLCNCYVFSTSNGCIVDAYCLPSPLIGDQISRMRLKAGITGDTGKHIFKSPPEAIAFIEHIMAKAK